MPRIRTIFFCTILSIAGFARAESLPLAIGEWAPFTGKNLSGYGIASEIVSAAMSAVGLEPHFKFIPWRRAEAEVLAGQSFATLPYLKIREREELFLFSTVLFSSKFAMIHLSERSELIGFSYDGPESLKGYRVGIVAGTEAVRAQLTAYGISVVELENPEPLLQMLELRRIDFAVDNREVLLYYTYRDFPDGTFTFLEAPFGERSEYRMMVSKSYPDAEALLDTFNEGLNILEESGELSNILMRYVPQ